MNEPASDEELHELFARQRAADLELTPRFSAMRARAAESAAAARPSISLAWRWGLSGAAAVGLALAAVLPLGHFAKPPASSNETLTRELAAVDAALQKSLAAQNALTAWQSPTDFLLDPADHENIP